MDKFKAGDKVTLNTDLYRGVADSPIYGMTYEVKISKAGIPYINLGEDRKWILNVNNFSLVKNSSEFQVGERVLVVHPNEDQQEATVEYVYSSNHSKGNVQVRFDNSYLSTYKTEHLQKLNPEAEKALAELYDKVEKEARTVTTGRPYYAFSVPKKEMIDGPSHYLGKDHPQEAIKVIEAWGLNFNLGNCAKYLSRAGKKDPAKTLEDLKKARWYLDREISNLEKK